MSTTLLSRDAILAAASAMQLPFEFVEVPELGGRVKVLGMTGAQRDAWEASCITGRGKKRDFNAKNIRARLAVRTLVNEQGTRLFNDGDADVLGQLPAAALNRIYEAAQRVNGISDEDVDELGKSSGDAAGTDSPSN
jgi:hypothetical protein